jgi:hypothetical protein
MEPPRPGGQLHELNGAPFRAKGVGGKGWGACEAKLSGRGGRLGSVLVVEWKMSDGTGPPAPALPPAMLGLGLELGSGVEGQGRPGTVAHCEHRDLLRAATSGWKVY